MPDPLTQRLYEVLSADAVLAPQLSAYAGVPAIFTIDPAPEDAEFPYLWIRGASLSADSSGITNCETRDFSRDIVVVADRSGDPVQIDDIGWRIQEIFRDKHGSALVGGLGGMPDPQGGVWYPLTLMVNGPVEASNDEDSYGRSVELSLTMERV